MAPKGGRGGSGGGSYSSGSCPNFGRHGYIPYFAGYIVFFLLTMIICIIMPCVRRRRRNQSTTTLLGPFFSISLLFLQISWVLTIIGSSLDQCNTIDLASASDMSLASNVFFYLGDYLLFVVIIWGVNAALGQRLGAHAAFRPHKIIALVILAVVGLLTIANIAMSSYQNWAFSRGPLESYFSIVAVMVPFWMAVEAVMIVALLVSFGMAVRSFRALRSRFGVSITKPLINITILTIAQILAALLALAPLAMLYQGEYIERNSSLATWYVGNFARIASFLAILCLAASRVWDQSATASAVAGADTVYQPVGDYGYGLGSGPMPVQRDEWRPTGGLVQGAR